MLLLAWYPASKIITTLSCMTQPFGGGIEGESNDYIKSMARTATCRMERDLRDFAYVDPDRRQDPAHTHAAPESLVELYFVSNASRTHDIRHTLQGSTLPDRLRFHSSPTGHRNG